MVHRGNFQGLGLPLLLSLVFWGPKSLLYEPPFLASYPVTILPPTLGLIVKPEKQAVILFEHDC